MMDSFRYVGTTATEIEEGEEIRRPIEPGEFTGAIDVSEEFPHNKMLFDEGRLLQLEPETEQVKEPVAPAPQVAASTTAGKAGESS